MRTSDLVFVGIKGAVVALNLATGEKVWATNLKGGDFVNVILDGGVILASCHGEIFCLEALTGKALWHNPLKGFGLGLCTLATDLNPGKRNVVLLGEKRRRDEADSAAAAAAASCG